MQTGANRCFSNFSAKHILEEMKKNVGQVRCSVRRSSQDGASSFPGSPGLKRALGLFGRSFAPEMANGLSWKPLRPSQWPVTQSFLLQVLRFPGVQLPESAQEQKHIQNHWRRTVIQFQMQNWFCYRFALQPEHQVFHSKSTLSLSLHRPLQETSLWLRCRRPLNPIAPERHHICHPLPGLYFAGP